MLRVLCSIVITVPLLSKAQAPDENVPVIQGGAGPCSLKLTVRGMDGKPVYAATVKVHIKYGFGGMRRLDLEAGTNSDGKVTFAGLPERVQRPPLFRTPASGRVWGRALPVASDRPIRQRHGFR